MVKNRLSITRFQVDTQLLPLFIPEIEMNQSDPNKTIYSITYKYLPPKTDDDDDDIQPIIVHQPIYWNPQSKNAPIPLLQVKQENLLSPIIITLIVSNGLFYRFSRLFRQDLQLYNPKPIP